MSKAVAYRAVAVDCRGVVVTVPVSWAERGRSRRRVESGIGGSNWFKSYLIFTLKRGCFWQTVFALQPRAGDRRFCYSFSPRYFFSPAGMASESRLAAGGNGQVANGVKAHGGL